MNIHDGVSAMMYAYRLPGPGQPEQMFPQPPLLHNRDAIIYVINTFQVGLEVLFSVGIAPHSSENPTDNWRYIFMPPIVTRRPVKYGVIKIAENNYTLNIYANQLLYTDQPGAMGNNNPAVLVETRQGLTLQEVVDILDQRFTDLRVPGFTDSDDDYDDDDDDAMDQDEEEPSAAAQDLSSGISRMALEGGKRTRRYKSIRSKKSKRSYKSNRSNKSKRSKRSYKSKRSNRSHKSKRRKH